MVDESPGLPKLRDLIVEHFNDDELRDLCFDLGVKYDSLGGGNTASKARELIAHMDRIGRLVDLVKACRRLRPKVIWPGAWTSGSTLPTQPYFFGRDEELARIADALDPDSTGWGVLIDGPGGIGKTALAIRAGHLASDELYPTKIFLSAKVRELTPRGEQQLEDYMLPNYMTLLAELARELGDDSVVKIDPNERAKAVRQLLSNQHALIIIDNLETFEDAERERLFQFLKRLPRTCKAVVTSRRRTDIAAEIIRLDRLKPEEARKLVDKLAQRNPRLARASDQERQDLYEVTKGNPLLIEWIAGQLGREGSQCRTVADTCKLLEVAPKDNDPLEYIFGDLLDTFTEHETAVLAALTHFTQPAREEWIAEVSGLALPAAQTALEDLTDRALLASDAQAHTFILPPLVATFLRRKRAHVISQAGERLTDGVYALALENGYRQYKRFPALEDGWPKIASALPFFLQGDNTRLQKLCSSLRFFLNYSGRWDERLSLSLQAEERAVAAKEVHSAGWRAYDAGRVYYMRGQAAEVLACADRARSYWATSSTRAKAIAIRLRGLGHHLEKDYPAAIAAFREALILHRTVETESDDVVIALNSLAEVESLSGDYAASEQDHREALRIAQKVGYREGESFVTGDLAELALGRGDWTTAETLAQIALSVATEIGRQELIARNSRRLAQALIRQNRKSEGLPYAQHAVEIYTQLRSPDLEEAQAVLKESVNE